MSLDRESVLREILEQSLAGYWDWDIATGNEYLSPGFKKMFGYEDHEIENRADSWQKLIFKEDLGVVLEKFKEHEASRGRVPYYSEVRYHHKDGSTVWVICTGKVIEWDELGKAKRMVGCHIDITERKLAEETLERNNLFVNSLLKAIPVAVFFKDNQGKYLGCNSVFSDVMGVTEDQIRGKTVHELWPSELAQKYHSMDLELMQTRKHQIYEYSIKARDGRILPVIYAKDVFLDSSGDVAGLVGAFIDISERRQAEEALRRSEEKYRGLIETTGTGYVFIDSNGCVLDANDEYVRLTGHVDLSEIVGRNVIEWTAEADKEKNTLAIKSCFLKGSIRNFEINYTDKFGRVTPIELNATCLLVDGNIQTITICRDISERKRTEEVLANAQKLESLGVLAGGIAHDFNNLMAGIFGYIELARVSSTEDSVRQYLAATAQTIDRARSLTGQLLTFAKGGSPIQATLPLFPFIKDAAGFALSGSNISCRFDVAPDLWSASFDKNQIGQVIDNLIINAQQAMPLGGTIELSARNATIAPGEHPVLKAGDYVRIAVIDTGIGIPKDLQKRIFDPFFTTKAKGHGLGLATCYSIISRHGGCIDVYSEPGRGSTFKVYLPASKEVPSGSVITTVQEHRGSGTFLVMDDEEVIRSTISALLRSFGYSVVCTHSGQEAIDCVAAALRNGQALEGMLFDLTVPGAMGGKEAIEKIRTMGVTIPAFVASGYADDPSIISPADYGFTASICKPFMRSELMEMLEKHMRRAGKNGD